MLRGGGYNLFRSVPLVLTSVTTWTYFWLGRHWLRVDPVSTAPVTRMIVPGRRMRALVEHCSKAALQHGAREAGGAGQRHRCTKATGANSHQTWYPTITKHLIRRQA